MSGTNKLVQSENAMKKESIEKLTKDLMDANNKAAEKTKKEEKKK